MRQDLVGRHQGVSDHVDEVGSTTANALCTVGRGQSLHCALCAVTAVHDENVCSSYTENLTDGCWSPTRPSVFFTARQDGVCETVKRVFVYLYLYLGF